MMNGPTDALARRGSIMFTTMLRTGKSILLLFLLGWTGSLSADVISYVDPRGRTVIIHSNAIVVQEDSSAITYKHFDLKERRVAKVRLAKGSRTYLIQRSPLDKRQQIVDTWKKFGHRAVAVDQTGKQTQIYAVYLDFFPPGGRGSLLESVPARVSFLMLFDSGAADEFDFAALSRAEIFGDRLRLTLRDGQTRSGKLLLPTSQSVEPRLMGITADYDPASPEVYDYSAPLAALREIRFGQ